MWLGLAAPTHANVVGVASVIEGDTIKIRAHAAPHLRAPGLVAKRLDYIPNTGPPRARILLNPLYVPTGQNSDRRALMVK